MIKTNIPRGAYICDMACGEGGFEGTDLAALAHLECQEEASCAKPTQDNPINRLLFVFQDRGP